MPQIIINRAIAESCVECLNEGEAQAKALSARLSEALADHPQGVNLIRELGSIAECFRDARGPLRVRLERQD